MKISWFITACSLITTCFCGEDMPDAISDNLRLSTEPLIINPTSDQDICYIKRDCEMDALQNDLAYIHNVERSSIAKGDMKKLLIPTDMLYMERDPELERKAQMYAGTCMQITASLECPLPDEDEGEVNIFIKEYDKNTKSTATQRAQSAITEWRSQLDNFEDYDHDLSAMVNYYKMPPKIEIAFHAAAKFIHSKVWKIGCGVADFLTTSTKFKEIIVCFYGPPKLKSGEGLYIHGCNPCSFCPSETSCMTDGEFKNTLCKVNPSSSPVFNQVVPIERHFCYVPNFESSEEETLSESPLSIPPSIKNPDEKQPVWSGKEEIGTQQCRGENSCFPGWEFKNGFAVIEVNGICSSVAVFRQKIYIDQISCFEFIFLRTIIPLSKIDSTEIPVTIFALVDSEQNKTVEKNTHIGGEIDSYHSISLNIPWTETYIYVGFATQSISENAKYGIKANKFMISKGECPSS